MKIADILNFIGRHRALKNSYRSTTKGGSGDSGGHGGSGDSGRHGSAERLGGPGGSGDSVALALGPATAISPPQKKISWGSSPLGAVQEERALWGALEARTLGGAREARTLGGARQARTLEGSWEAWSQPSAFEELALEGT